MNVRREPYFSIHTKNKPGDAASVTASLMGAGVNCSGIWAFETGKNDAEIFVVPKSPDAFMKLARSEKWKTSEGMSFHVEGQDKTGALVDTLNTISEEGINLRAVDAIAIEGSFGCYLFPHENDAEHVAQLLGLSTPRA